ncbi:non-hydrolyzing UDP-N-acetylglucosamine 2-epimerase [Arachidicoccus sp.]|uniref:non-hydrolyzing UDP-N-acetylglucosamine 2-epimerase n=1 Tax=Arachidicoccus sp. TaxID=1872624 RepID=UPI003D1B8D6B
MKKLLFIFGTRPEAIKMAPIIHAAKKLPKTFEIKICLTGQHKEMLQQVMQFFKLQEDFDISLMKPNQTLFDITAEALTGIQKVLEKFTPDLILVQGDTTTAFVGALAAYYKKIKIAHVEAGLRSFDKYAPFPEEINRKMVASLADIHFAPTIKAAQNLQSENIQENIFVTGNTVIDALLWAKEKTFHEPEYANDFNYLNLNKKIILVTGHRRESFGKPFEEICEALYDLSISFPDVQIVYPVHLNPNVQEVVKRHLSNRKNVFLVSPMDYPHLVWLMNHSYIVLTDSGGIQEEAPSLGKPVLVMREVTERTEGIEAGTAILVGTSKEKIKTEVTQMLQDEQHYQKMSRAVNPYGTGDSAEKIIRILQEYL